MRDRESINLAIVEFLGPLVLVFVGVGAIIQTQRQQLLPIALAHGLAIGLMISAVGHITGGAFNPAVTLGLFVTGRLQAARAILYGIAQLLGGVVGAALLTVVYPDLGPIGRNTDGVNLGVPALGPNSSIGSGLVMEIVLTFLLMFVIFGVAIDHRTGRVVSGLIIGLTITMDILAGGAVSGAVMNPARAFGPALVQQDFADHWVWWLGPAIGAIIAALLYHHVLLDDGAPSTTRAAERDRVLPDASAEDDAEGTTPTAGVRSRSRRSQRRRR